MKSVIILAVVAVLVSAEGELSILPYPAPESANLLYDPRSQVCCSGSVVNVTDDKRTCCQSTMVYDPVTELCGTQSVIRKPVNGPDDDGIYKICFMDSVYNEKTQMCCGLKVVDIPAGADTADVKCCDDLAYDSKKQVCCGKTLHPREGTAGKVCCESTLIDRATSLCCLGGVLPKTSAAEKCCGDKTYNVATQLCCNSPASYPEAFTVLDSQSGTLQCCGNVTINPDKQECVCEPNSKDGYLNTQCLPADLTDFSSDGPSQNNIAFGICGSTKYDPTKQLCCGEKLYPWSQYPDSGCCGNEAFRSLSQLCCDGATVSDNTGRDLACCGSQQYNTTTSKCCGSTIHQRMDGMECCGSNIYSSCTQRCCGSTVYSKESTAHLSCCGPMWQPNF